MAQRKGRKQPANHPWKTQVLGPRKTDAEICETERMMAIRDYMHRHRRR